MSERTYRLERDEPIPEGIARVAYGRIDNALDELDGQTDSSAEKAVHNARKDMKKLRALLRLVRGETGDQTYRHESATFRDAGRELSGVRDADVMIATLGSLELAPEEDGPLRQALEAHKIRTAAGGREQAAITAVGIIGSARGRVAGWPLERNGFGAFAEGLRRIYRQGRRNMHAARKEPTAENLHEWRKRTKDLWYHLALLEAAWPPVMHTLADEAHQLSDRLGDDHDLAVLLEWASEHADSSAIEHGVTERRLRLQAEAFAYGARLYADQPSVFVGRVESWWETSARAASAEAAHH
ncbi:MAG TPA: CHAD domain-containing protein [Thermoleophilaceae bacterium]|nr:CHAD domain-containing protein [Thermoleophilaceae bacterium]